VPKKYMKGYRFELNTKKYMEKRGFYVVRSAGSRGIFDLLSVKNGKVYGIQCKTSKITSAELTELIDNAKKYGIIPVYATLSNGVDINIYGGGCMKVGMLFSNHISGDKLYNVLIDCINDIGLSIDDIDSIYIPGSIVKNMTDIFDMCSKYKLSCSIDFSEMCIDKVINKSDIIIALPVDTTDSLWKYIKKCINDEFKIVFVINPYYCKSVYSGSWALASTQSEQMTQVSRVNK